MLYCVLQYSWVLRKILASKTLRWEKFHKPPFMKLFFLLQQIDFYCLKKKQGTFFYYYTLWVIDFITPFSFNMF